MADEEASLREQLSKAFEDSEKEDETLPQANVGDPKESAGDENLPDAHTEDQHKDAVEDSDGDPKISEADGDKDEGHNTNDTLTPPETWSAADKETFARSPRDVQEWALRRHQEMTADYTRKTMEISDLKKTWGPLQEMFAPHIAQGVQVAPLIQSWAQVASHLQQNPAEALQQLARQYNVDLGQLTPKQKDDIWGDESNTNVVDPRISELEQRIQHLTGHLQQRDQLEQQSKVTAFTNDIQAFAQQKTEAGELAHPHFDELIPEMMTMAQAIRASGQQPNIKDLYDKALWANPSTREKVLAAQRQAAAKKAEDEAIAKAKKARQAGKSVGGSASTTLRPEMSLREMIESQF